MSRPSVEAIAASGSAEALPGKALNGAGGEGPLERLRAALPGITGTARTCGACVLENPWEVGGLSIGALAKRCGVSENAVNRFSRTLGYRGYREFSQALVMELGKILGSAYAAPEGGPAVITRDRDVLLSQRPTGQPQTAQGVVSRVLAQELDALQETVHALDESAVERAVQALAAAQSILFVGTGMGLTLCEIAAYRLKYLGLRATWAGEPGMILPELHLMGCGDVLCAISHHGLARNVLDALEHARERGLTTICITAVPTSPAAQLGDVVLTTVAPLVGFGFAQSAPRSTAIALLEALSAGVAWATRDASAGHAAALRQAIEERTTVTRRRRTG